MPRAEGTFDIDKWDGESYDEREGATLGRAHIEKTFQGGLRGTSATDILTAMAQVEGSAAYVGFERFTGTVGERTGTFVLHHNASGSGGEQWMTWTIVPDSGTGELRGIRGEGQICATDGVHSYHLDYELD